MNGIWILRYMNGLISTVFGARLSGFVLLFAFSAIGFGQDTQPSKPIDVNVSSKGNIVVVIKPNPVILSSDDDYLVGQNDVLNIRIDDAPELSGSYRLNSNGDLSMAIVGNINAEDKTIEEITQTIVERLRGGYLVNPIVSVSVEQSNRRAFFIQGEVLRPGTYQIEGNVTLLKLITIAGGLSGKQGLTISVIRGKRVAKQIHNASGGLANADDTNDQYDVVKVNINRLYRGVVDQNIIIKPGDLVTIAAAEVFFVDGEVRQPGSYPIKEGTTVLQAIAIAGGLSDVAGQYVFITRAAGPRDPVSDEVANLDKANNDKTRKRVIKIDIEKLRRGELVGDFVLRPRDVVYVARKDDK